MKTTRLATQLFLAAALLPGAAQAVPKAAQAPPRPLAQPFAREAGNLAERVRAAALAIAAWRDKAAAPGLEYEERDALADAAWAVHDAVLDDPAVRDEALRTPAFLREQALLLMDGGECQEALVTLQRLRSVAPRDPETDYLFGEAFVALGRHTEGAQAFRLALERGVDGPAEARAHLAHALAEAGRLDESLAEADRAIAEDPGEYHAHFVLGRILGRLGRAAEARRSLLAAVGLFRDDADLWEELGKAWERAGERARALSCFREVLRIEPSDAAAEAKARELSAAAPAQDR